MNTTMKRMTGLTLAVLFAFLLFFCQYQFDNKYRGNENFGVSGVIDLRTPEKSVTMLAYGWEVWPQQLLTPEELAGLAPEKVVYLGQYNGFEFGNPNGSAHGCATYRQVVLLPAQETRYMLEIPEVYSAAKVWVNGALLWQSGEVQQEGYTPLVKTGSVEFYAKDQAELVVQAADDTHYYSGMVYPPAFGNAQAVSQLLLVRQLFCAVLCTTALVIGALCLLVGLKLKSRRRLMLAFAMLCLCFAGYVCYPILHRFGVGMWAYRFEDVCFYAMLFAVVYLHRILCGMKGTLSNIVLGVSAAICVFSLFAPLILADSLQRMLLYSAVINGYKFLLFGYLIASGFLASRHKEPMAWPLLMGLCVFATALLCNVAFPLFEPILFGWQTELAAFFLVMLLAGVLWRDAARAYRERAALHENLRMLRVQFSLQEQNYRLITENFEELKKLRHDLRHHDSVLLEFAKNGEVEEIQTYLEGVGEDTQEVLDQPVCVNPAVNAVLHYHVRLAKEKEIPLSLQVALPESMPIQDWDLGILFGNLIENALEASLKLNQEQRQVSVYASFKDENFLLTVQNRYDGGYSRQGERFLSGKHDGAGIGLTSVGSIAEKYGGKLYVNPQEQLFEVSVVILQKQAAAVHATQSDQEKALQA